MSGPVTLESLDLAALLCSRVCHDLISPVGAVVNGIEVMEDDADEQTKAFAVELIKKSATTASARLQFCRIAFGAAGSAGASIDTGDAEGVARGMMEDEKTRITWNLPRALLPKNRPGGADAGRRRGRKSDRRPCDPAVLYRPAGAHLRDDRHARARG